MARSLDIITLDGAAKHYAAEFVRADLNSPGGAFISGPSYVMQDFFNFVFKDEFERMMGAFRNRLGPASLDEFEVLAKGAFKPRDEKTFHKLLADRLAIDPDGEHIPGKIGTTIIGGRRLGVHLVEVETTDSVRRRKRLGLPKEGNRETENRLVSNDWPIYMGEGHERAADSGVADPLPSTVEPLPLGALNTRIANVIAIKACDVIVDELDTGSVDGFIDGRSGSQPADPDTAITGTRLFALDLATPAFGAAADAAPGGEATAGAIADDTSADATGTLGYCRAASANTIITSLDDLIDGEAGTSGADFNFNTLSIVSGSTVSMTSWTVKMPES